MASLPGSLLQMAKMVLWDLASLTGSLLQMAKGVVVLGLLILATHLKEKPS